jgi:NhaP-type Na+/H+ or K+/H+ antiporter
MNILQALNTSFWIHILWSICIGFLIGYLHFYTLPWNISLFLKRRKMIYAIAIQILRIAIATNVLFVCIRLNISQLAVIIGFLLARWQKISDWKKA